MSWLPVLVREADRGGPLGGHHSGRAVPSVGEQSVHENSWSQPSRPGVIQPHCGGIQASDAGWQVASQSPLARVSEGIRACSSHLYVSPAGTWEPLPEVEDHQAGFPGYSTAGDELLLDYSGWVLDTTANRWIAASAPPDDAQEGSAVAWAGQPPIRLGEESDGKRATSGS